jgi:hypothetical protein
VTQGIEAVALTQKIQELRVLLAEWVSLHELCKEPRAKRLVRKTRKALKDSSGISSRKSLKKVATETIKKVICNSYNPKLCKGCIHSKPHNRDEFKGHKDGFDRDGFDRDGIDSACSFDTCGVTGKYLPIKCVPVGERNAVTQRKDK